jgi:hypothetical protein
MSLFRGKLYRCAFLAHGESLRAFPYNRENGFDLTGDFTASGFKEYLNRESAYPGCRWCSGDPTEKEYIPIAVQADGPLEYKIYAD